MPPLLVPFGAVLARRVTEGRPTSYDLRRHLWPQ